MSGEEFFNDMTLVSDWMFDMMSMLWALIMSNWILTLSFAIVLVSLVVYILRRIRNIK